MLLVFWVVSITDHLPSYSYTSASCIFQIKTAQSFKMKEVESFFYVIINGSIQKDGNKNDVTMDLIRDAKNATLMFLSIVFSQISFW